MNRRPSLGGAINAAAGALQNHLLLQQLKLAQQQNPGSDHRKSVAGSETEETLDGIVFSGNPHETELRGACSKGQRQPARIHRDHYRWTGYR